MAIRSPWWGLTALCLPMLIVSMDVSVLFFAVPYIAADLEPSAAQQLWIFDIYGFVLAGLLLTMGSVADRIGHRRLLMLGAAGFGAASVVAAFATSAEMLIGARALLAVAGATLMPSTLAMIRHLFDDEDARRKAIATLERRAGRWGRRRADHQRLSPRTLLVGVGVPHQRARHGGAAARRSGAAARTHRGPRPSGGRAQCGSGPRRHPAGHRRDQIGSSGLTVRETGSTDPKM